MPAVRLALIISLRQILHYIMIIPAYCVRMRDTLILLLRGPMRLCLMLLLAFVLSAAATLTPAAARPRTPPTVNCQVSMDDCRSSLLAPLWTTGIITDQAGMAGILVRDLSGDGTTEIAT